MFRPLILGAAMALAPLAAQADTAEDLAFIAAQVATEATFRAAIESQRDILTSAIENDLRQEGITISDLDGYFTIFIDEFIAEFTETMQSETQTIYRNAFTDAELAGIADFYRTEAGQALIRQTPVVMQAGAEAGQIAGMAAGQNAAGRVADRLEAEGISLSTDPDVNQRLLDMLRR